MSDVNRTTQAFQPFYPQSGQSQTASIAVASGASTNGALTYPTTDESGIKRSPGQFLCSNSSTTPAGVYFSYGAGNSPATATNVHAVIPAGGVKVISIPGGPTGVSTWGFGAGTGTVTVTPGDGV